MEGGVIVRWTVQRWSLLLVLSLTIVASASAADPDESFSLFPYRLVTSTLFGRISDSALPGSHVPVDETLPLSYNVGEKEYIKLGLIPSKDYHPEPHGDVTDHNHSTNVLLALPPGVSWRVSEVEGEEREEAKGSEGGIGGEGEIADNMAFTVDGKFYLSVLEPKVLAKYSVVEFWVVAILHNVEVVSSPLPFVIKIDHQEELHGGSTLYVGIVVLVICMFALLIPLTVRTKRRMRQGRSVCACGSAQDDSQKAVSGGIPNPRDEQRDNLAASLYGGRGSSVESDPNRPETFQHHMLRSDSDHHFQPRWLDPHFEHGYEHPNYNAKVPSPLARQSGASSSSSANRVVGKF